MQSPRSHHYGIWMTTLVAVLLAGVYVGALVFLSRTQKTVASQAAEIAGEARREGSMHELSDLLNDLSSETTKLDAFFISPDGAVGVIEDMEALSSIISAPITVSDVRIEDQDATTGEGMLTMNVAASGSWRSMVHLLTLLDALPFQSELNSATLTLSNADGEDSDARWSLRALLKVSLRR
ncbi:MAG: hypothetical protein RLY47_373 [Candidatus Parcubacteria bacterium]|jgi:hypothetical protein